MYLVVDFLAMVFVCFVVLELKSKALHMLNIHSVIKLDPKSIKIFFLQFYVLIITFYYLFFASYRAVVAHL